MKNDPPVRYRRRRRARRERVAESLLALAEEQATILSTHETGWASVTFAGSRHKVELLFEGAEAVEAGERFIVLFPDHEFELPRQLVVEAAITVVEHRLEPPRMRVVAEVMLVEQG